MDRHGHGVMGVRRPWGKSTGRGAFNQNEVLPVGYQQSGETEDEMLYLREGSKRAFGPNPAWWLEVGGQIEELFLGLFQDCQ